MGAVHLFSFSSWVVVSMSALNAGPHSIVQKERLLTVKLGLGTSHRVVPFVIIVVGGGARMSLIPILQVDSLRRRENAPVNLRQQHRRYKSIKIYLFLLCILLLLILLFILLI